MQTPYRGLVNYCEELTTQVSSSDMDKMTSLPLILASCWVLGDATITMKDNSYIDSGFNKTYTDNITFVSAARSQLDCALQCNQHDSCLTLTFHENTCTVHDVYMSPCSASTPATGARSFARKIETWPRCERTGVKRMIDTSIGLDRDVYCDGDWLVFQRRIDGSVDFYRGWDEYVTGFGDVYGEYWLGLEDLHRITTSCESYELKVILTAFNGTIGTASYSNFYVGPATDNYTLHYDSFLGGNAGDSLTIHRNQPFSTLDADNDVYPGSCAVNYHGAWWYGWCHISHLNGEYRAMEITDNKGISWMSFTSDTRKTLKSCQMMIRPV